MRPLLIGSLVYITAITQPIGISAQMAEADSVTRAFREILTLGDAQRLGELFAESVVFEGDGRFVGAPVKEGRYTVSRGELRAAFFRLFAEMGADWGELIRTALPNLNIATRDAEYHALAIEDDLVYSLSAPGRGGPDDTLVFVFRRIAGRFLVVAHYGDY